MSQFFLLLASDPTQVTDFVRERGEDSAISIGEVSGLDKSIGVATPGLNSVCEFESGVQAPRRLFMLFLRSQALSYSASLCFPSQILQPALSVRVLLYRLIQTVVDAYSVP